MTISNLRDLPFFPEYGPPWIESDGPILKFPTMGESTYPTPVKARQWKFVGKNESVTVDNEDILDNFHLLSDIASMSDQSTITIDLSDSAISPSAVQTIIDVLKGMHPQLSSENIFEVLKAADFFNVPKFMDKLRENRDELVQSLVGLEPNLQWEEIDRIFDILSTFFTPNICEECLLQGPSELEAFKCLPEYKDKLPPLYQLICDMNASLSDGNPIEDSFAFKTFKMKLSSLGLKEIIAILAYLPKAKTLMKPIFETVMMEFFRCGENDDHWNKFFNQFKTGLRDNKIVNGFINELKTSLKKFNHIREKINKKVSNSELKSSITESLRRLGDGIKEIEDFIRDNPAGKVKNPDLESLRKLKMMQSIVKKCLENLDGELDLTRHRQSKLLVILITFFLLVPLSAIVICLSGSILNGTLPGHMHTLINIIMLSAGIGVPLYLVCSLIILALSFQHKLKKKHLIQGLHRLVPTTIN